MRLVQGKSWQQRGISLLWNARVLFERIESHEAISIRQFFACSQAWPEELPSCGGNTIVVAGLRSTRLARLEGISQEVRTAARVLTIYRDWERSHQEQAKRLSLFFEDAGRYD